MSYDAFDSGDSEGYDAGQYNGGYNEGGFDSFNGGGLSGDGYGPGFGDTLDPGNYDISGLGEYNDNLGWNDEGLGGLNAGYGNLALDDNLGGNAYVSNAGDVADDDYGSALENIGDYDYGSTGLDSGWDAGFDGLGAGGFDSSSSFYGPEYAGLNEGLGNDGFSLADDYDAGNFGGGLAGIGSTGYESNLGGALNGLDGPGSGFGSSSLLEDAAVLGGGAALGASAASLYNETRGLDGIGLGRYSTGLDTSGASYDTSLGVRHNLITGILETSD